MEIQLQQQTVSEPLTRWREKSAPHWSWSASARWASCTLALGGMYSGQNKWVELTWRVERFAVNEEIFRSRRAVFGDHLHIRAPGVPVPVSSHQQRQFVYSVTEWANVTEENERARWHTIYAQKQTKHSTKMPGRPSAVPSWIQQTRVQRGLEKFSKKASEHGCRCESVLSLIQGTWTKQIMLASWSLVQSK